MNQYLESAARRYKNEKGVIINPISKLDAQIIWQLMIILNKFGAKVVVEILESYKYLKDFDILDLLQEWNESNTDGVEETNNDGENKSDPDIFKRRFIDMESGILELWLVKSADIDEMYNYNTNEQEYRIVINKGFPEGSPYADKAYCFKTPEVRDERYEVLLANMNKDVIIL